MRDQIEKYTAKLLRDGTAVPGSIRFYVLDDKVIAGKSDEWVPVFTEVFTGLNVTALLFARPSSPFADMLIARSAPGLERLTPKDSETKTFLHDIPFIRTDRWQGRPHKALAKDLITLLRERKAVMIEGLGVVAAGGVTVEQAFIGFSSIYHTTFVKYLLDLLTEGFRLPDECRNFERIAAGLPSAPDMQGLAFADGPVGTAGDDEAIYQEIARVGRYTVEKGLVDSFFGNISYFDGRTIYISQTASSLDELEGRIDPVPLDGSSTAGLSASSELPAHRAIYLASDYRAVLHGHPRFSVILSMLCSEKDCDIEDCNRKCDRVRSTCGVPIVAGETGAGGLAKSVPAAMKDAGVCIVYGHGVFTAGKKDFREAFRKMVEVENRCREEYLRIVQERWRGAAPP